MVVIRIMHSTYERVWKCSRRQFIENAPKLNLRSICMLKKELFCKRYKSIYNQLFCISSFIEFDKKPIYLFTMFRLTLACAIVACAAAIPAGPPAPYHPAPAPYHAPAPAPYHAPAPAYHPAKPIEEAPKPYAFEYGVADDYSGANFKAAETADGKVVSGSYQVNLPDGRVQTVTYTADHYNGFVADVSYEGVPHYPEAKAYKPHPAPAYKPIPHPAPVYHAAPAPYHA